MNLCFCKNCGQQFIVIGERRDQCPECEHDGKPSPTHGPVTIEVDETGRSKVVENEDTGH